MTFHDMSILCICVHNSYKCTKWVWSFKIRLLVGVAYLMIGVVCLIRLLMGVAYFYTYRKPLVI